MLELQQPFGQGSPDRSRWQPLAGGVVLVGEWAAALWGLSPVFAAGPWTTHAFLVCVAVILVASLVRVARPSAGFLACLAGLAAGVGVLISFVAVGGSGDRWIADPEAMIQAVRLQLYAGTAPMPVAGPMHDVILVAVLLAAWLSTLLLVGIDSVMVAGVIPAAVVLTVPAATGARVATPVLVVLGVLLCLLLWVGAPRGPGWQRRAVAAVVTLVVAGGLSVALPATRDRVWNTAAVSLAPIGPTVPDVTIALAEDLRKGGSTVAFEYRGTAQGESTRFPLATLTTFEGGTWRPDDALDPGTKTLEDPQLPWPMATGLDGSVIDGLNSSGRATTIRIDALVSSWLPLVQGTGIVTGASGADPESRWQASDWQWTADAQTARSTTTLTARHDAFTVRSWPLDAKELLKTAATSEAFDQWPVAEKPSNDVIGVDSTPPADLPQNIITEARQVTQGSHNRMEAAQHLVAHFTSGEFSYDESAPYTPGSDPSDPFATVESFLDQKSGYCVHFASAFALMARSLGMPTRIAVGYASRSEGASSNSDGWTPVRASDLHAWPEVFFEGIGWVSFEPTPGGAGARADGLSPEELDQASAGAEPTPSASPQASSASPTPSASRSASRSSTEIGSADGGAITGADRPGLDVRIIVTWVLGILLAALLIASPGLVRAWRRQRRLAAADTGVPGAAGGAWAEFVDEARDLGILGTTGAGGRAGGASESRPRALTPAALIDHLEKNGALGVATGGVAARRVAEAAESEAFGQGESPTDAALGDEVRAAVSDLRKRARRAQRFRAVVWPQSLWRRNVDA